LFIKISKIFEINMTLKELLKSCDFKDVAPFITKHDPKAVGSMSHFKEAFDILRHLTPEANSENEDKVIRMSKEYDDVFQNHYIRASCTCGVDSWESNLAKEIVVEDGLTLTDNEIAAHCLWELTFFGFDLSTDDGWAKSWDRIEGKIDRSNPYAVAAEKLDNKLWENYLPKRFKEYRGETSLPAEAWEQIERRQMRKNRAKRKRDHRQEQRVKALERKAKIEDAIRRLIADTLSFSRTELTYLFDTELINEGRYHSRAYNVAQRMDYLIDLFSYESEDFSKYTRFLLMFRTSSDYPLVQSELEKIQNFFNQYLPASANIRYGYGTDEKLGTEVSLLLVGTY